MSNTIKSVLLFILLVLQPAWIPVAAAPQRGQTPPARDLKELRSNYDKKLQRDFVSKVAWSQVMRDALKSAKEAGKPLLVYFTRSDRAWPPCDEVEEGALLQEWWIKSSERFVPYLNIQTGGLKLPEEAWLERLADDSVLLPLFLFLDHEGKVITTFRLRDATTLEKALGEAEELLAARKDAKEKGDPLSKKRLSLIEGLREKKPDFSELGRLAGVTGMDPHLVARFERLRNVYPVREVLAKSEDETNRLRGTNTIEGFDEIRKRAASSIYDLYKRKGIRIEDRSEELYREFWELTFEGAILAGDRKTASDSFQTFERAFGNEEGKTKDRIQKMREELARLR